jgi:hypothetical protein
VRNLLTSMPQRLRWATAVILVLVSGLGVCGVGTRAQTPAWEIGDIFAGVGWVEYLSGARTTCYPVSMADLSLDRHVTISESAIFRELDGESVIVHLDSSLYYGLDPVGTRLWQLIDSHGHLRSVFDAALAEFDVEPSVLERDLLQLVSELAGRQLVEFK